MCICTSEKKWRSNAIQHWNAWNKMCVKKNTDRINFQWAFSLDVHSLSRSRRAQFLCEFFVFVHTQMTDKYYLFRMAWILCRDVSPGSSYPFHSGIFEFINFTQIYIRSYSMLVYTMRKWSPIWNSGHENEILLCRSHVRKTQNFIINIKAARRLKTGERKNSKSCYYLWNAQRNQFRVRLEFNQNKWSHHQFHVLIRCIKRIVKLLKRLWRYRYCSS